MFNNFDFFRENENNAHSVHLLPTVDIAQTNLLIKSLRSTAAALLT